MVLAIPATSLAVGLKGSLATASLPEVDGQVVVAFDGDFRRTRVPRLCSISRVGLPDPPEASRMTMEPGHWAGCPGSDDGVAELPVHADVTVFPDRNHRDEIAIRWSSLSLPLVVVAVVIEQGEDFVESTSCSPAKFGSCITVPSSISLRLENRSSMAPVSLGKVYRSGRKRKATSPVQGDGLARQIALIPYANSPRSPGRRTGRHAERASTQPLLDHL